MSAWSIRRRWRLDASRDSLDWRLDPLQARSTGVRTGALPSFPARRALLGESLEALEAVLTQERLLVVEALPLQRQVDGQVPGVLDGVLGSRQRHRRVVGDLPGQRQRGGNGIAGSRDAVGQ